MADYGFFALLSRMKYIDRWSLMRNVRRENLMEHSYEVSVIAHALAIIGKNVYSKDIEPEKIATAALYHDCCEIITGDMPTPIKYENDTIRAAYKQVEKKAVSRLAAMIPKEMEDGLGEYLHFEENQSELYRYVKAADRLSAYLKCLSEEQAGNGDFRQAKEQIMAQIKAINMAEVEYFMDNLAVFYGKTLDDLLK